MIEIVIGLLRPYLLRIALGAGLAIAAGAGFEALKVHYTNAGYRKAIAAIAAQDKEAVDAANEARDRVRACYDAGRVWDISEGECSRQ